MDKTKISEQRHRLLESLKEELNAAEIAAELRDEDGFEMVSAMLDEVGDTDSEMMGDFFFRPLLSEEDEMQYFAAVLTIPDQIGEDRLPVAGIRAGQPPRLHKTRSGPETLIRRH